MIDTFLIGHPEVALGIWALLAVSDYYLTIAGARLYRETFSRFVDLDGSYELEALFKKEVDALRTVSPQFVWRLFLSGALLLGYWWLTVRAFDLAPFFLVLFGGYVLVQLAVHVRHVRNIELFRLAREPGAIEGRIKYARRVTERVAVTEFLYFAVFFAVYFALSGKVIFLGGTLGCIAQSRRLSAQAKRARPRIRTATPADASNVARVHVESWKVAYRGIMPDDKIAKMDLATRTTLWAERIAAPEWPILVIAEGRTIVAFCHMVPSPDPDDDPQQTGHITSIHVLPSFRSRGHGRALLDHACAEFRRRGYREVTLWVLERNDPARRFYERLGFREDGGRKAYPGTKVPEVRYRIRLSVVSAPATC